MGSADLVPQRLGNFSCVLVARRSIIVQQIAKKVTGVCISKRAEQPSCSVLVADCFSIASVYDDSLRHMAFALEYQCSVVLCL